MAGITDQITQYYNDPNLTSLKQNATDAASTAANYQSAAALLPSKLKEAIQQKLDYNKDIIAPQQQAMANYFAAPSAARSQYQDIFNPFDREKLVAQATSNAYAPYATLTNILGERRGNINDIVQAGTGAFNAQVGQAQNAATNARQNYSDSLGLADKLAGIAQWGYEQTHKASAGGGGIDPTSLLALFAGLNQGGQTGGTLPAGAQQVAKIYDNPQAYIEQLPGNESYTAVPDSKGGFQIYKLPGNNNPLGLGF